MQPTLRAEPQGCLGTGSWSQKTSGSFWPMHILTHAAFGVAGHLSAPSPANNHFISSFIWLSFPKHFLVPAPAEAFYSLLNAFTEGLTGLPPCPDPSSPRRRHVTKGPFPVCLLTPCPGPVLEIGASPCLLRYSEMKAECFLQNVLEQLEVTNPEIPSCLLDHF